LPLIAFHHKTARFRQESAGLQESKKCSTGSRKEWSFHDHDHSQRGAFQGGGMLRELEASSKSLSLMRRLSKSLFAEGGDGDDDDMVAAAFKLLVPVVAMLDVVPLLDVVVAGGLEKAKAIAKLKIRETNTRNIAPGSGH